MHRIYFTLWIIFTTLILIIVFQNIIIQTPGYILTSVMNGGYLMFACGLLGAAAGMCFLLYYMTKKAMAQQGDDSSTI